MTLLIDGHNLIGVMPDIDIADPDDEWQLVSRLRGYTTRHKGRLTVVFDAGSGPPPNWNLSGGGVMARFVSPGRTADEEILRLVRSSKRPDQVTVVTNDRELADLVRTAGGQVRSASQFAGQLIPPPASFSPADSAEAALDPQDPAFADLYAGFLAAEKDKIHFKGAAFRRPEEWIEKLYEGNPPEAQQAARWLGRFGGDEAVEPLLDALTHSNGNVRAAALLALGSLGASSGVETMAGRLASDPSGLVREAAAQALGRLGGLAAEQALQAALSDPKAKVRKAASASLAQLRARRPGR